MQIPNLSESQYFHASNIFKNKLKIDFVALKSQSEGQVISSLKDNLLGVIKTLNQKRYIMENLCLGMSYLILHTHQIWTNFIPELVGALSGSIQEAQCLFSIIGYLASECEDEGVVIEESLRESFFDFIDNISPVVFKDIFNSWAEKIINNKDEENASIKNAIVYSFWQWIKLKLPKELI